MRDGLLRVTGPRDLDARVPRRAQVLPRGALRPPRAERGRSHDRGSAVAGLAACLGWLPFLWRPLSPDEGGFLIVASQWGSGIVAVRRLLGRPAAGADRALRAGRRARRPVGRCGCSGRVAVVATVLLAGVLGRLAAPERRSAPADRPPGPPRSSPPRRCSAAPSSTASCWRCRSSLAGHRRVVGRVARQRSDARGAGRLRPARRRRRRARGPHQAEPARRLRGGPGPGAGHPAHQRLVAGVGRRSAVLTVLLALPGEPRPRHACRRPVGRGRRPSAATPHEVIAESATGTTPRRLAGVLGRAGRAARPPFVAVALPGPAARPVRPTAAATCAGRPCVLLVVGAAGGAAGRQLLAALPDGAGPRAGAARCGVRPAPARDGDPTPRWCRTRWPRSSRRSRRSATSSCIPIDRPEAAGHRLPRGRRRARATARSSCSAAPTSSARPG